MFNILIWVLGLCMGGLSSPKPPVATGLNKPQVKREENVHVVFGSLLRPCKPSALDLTIANTWVRSSS